MEKDKEFRQKLSEKLENFEAQPQEQTWDNIRFSVELRKKMDDYEVSPDKNTWNEIRIPLQLQQKFDEYEVLPQEETWKNIQAALEKKKQRKIIILPIIYRIGTAAALIMALTGIFQLIFNQEKTLASKKLQAPLIVHQPKKTQQLPIITKDQKIFSSSLEKLRKNSAKETVISQYTLTALDKKQQTMSATDSLIQNQPINQIIEQNTIAYENSNTSSLDLIESKKIELPNFSKALANITLKENSEGKKVKEKKKLIITSGVMPLQTYQAMTILPQNNVYIQQINNLNALDAQRLGVQARLGFLQTISKKFSSGASLSYSGLQQVINYETNSGNYQLQINDNQNYSLTSIGENISQQKFLHALGIKVDNALQISKKKNKVVLLAGGEAVRVLNDNRFAYYLNASVAFSYSNRNGKNVWIEPSYRYNLSQTSDINNYLQVRASNIGINVRVNFM